MPPTTRRTNNRNSNNNRSRRPASSRRRPKKSSNKGLLGGVGGGALVLVIILVKVLSNGPSWQTVDQGTETIPGDQALAIQFTVRKKGPVRLTVKAESGKQLWAYWVDQKDYRQIQAPELTDPTLLERMLSQTFFNETSSGSKQLEAGPGTVHVCMESSTEEPVRVEYKVEVFR